MILYILFFTALFSMNSAVQATGLIETLRLLGFEPVAIEDCVLLSAGDYPTFTNIESRIGFLKNISWLQDGGKKPGSAGTGYKKPLIFMEKEVTLRQMVCLEKKIKEKNLTTYETALAETLSQAIKYFESMYDWQEASNKKTFGQEIMKKWFESRKKHGFSNEDSILFDWERQPAGTERTYFRKRVISHAILFDFLEELKMFLVDFMYSCPRSVAAYDAGVAEEHHLHHE